MAKDIIHDAVKQALIKDGWTITHDPLFIRIKGIQMYIDLEEFHSPYKRQLTEFAVG